MSIDLKLQQKGKREKQKKNKLVAYIFESTIQHGRPRKARYLRGGGDLGVSTGRVLGKAKHRGSRGGGRDD